MTADTTLRKLTEQMYESLNSFLFELNDERTRGAINLMLRMQIRQIAQMHNLDVDTDRIGLDEYQRHSNELEVNEYTVTFLKSLNELIKEEDRLATKALLKHL
jgi:hypothetical protein